MAIIMAEREVEGWRSTYTCCRFKQATKAVEAEEEEEFRHCGAGEGERISAERSRGQGAA